jgi:hypothetical protein
VWKNDVNSHSTPNFLPFPQHCAAGYDKSAAKPLKNRQKGD